MPHAGRHLFVPQHVPGMQAYPGGQSEFSEQSETWEQNEFSQQKQLPSTSGLQYASPNGPQPDPHCCRFPPQVQEQSTEPHSTQPASACDPRLVTTGVSQATAVPIPIRFMRRLREILLAVLSSSILHPLPVRPERLSQGGLYPLDAIDCKCSIPISAMQLPGTGRLGRCHESGPRPRCPPSSTGSRPGSGPCGRPRAWIPWRSSS